MSGKARDLVFVAMAGLLLLAPSIGYVSGMAPPPATAEKRIIAPAPRWNQAPLYVSLTDFEKHFADTFRMRQHFLLLGNAVRFFVLRTPTSKIVITGNDGQLFVRDYPNFDRYLERHPFTETELSRWIASFLERDQWAARFNGRYVFVVIPDTHTIIPEKLPNYLRQTQNTPRAKQLTDAVAAYNSSRCNSCRAIEFFTLHGAVGAVRETGVETHYRTDSHWNQLGAFYGSLEVLQRLQKIFPDSASTLTPTPFDSFTLVKRERSGDLAKLLGLSKFIKEEAYFLEPKIPRRAIIETADTFDEEDFSTVLPTGNDKALLSAVVFRDSSARLLYPHLSEHFRRARYVWTQEFDSELIEREQPTVVLHFVTERFLYYMPVPRPGLLKRK